MVLNIVVAFGPFSRGKLSLSSPHSDGNLFIDRFPATSSLFKAMENLDAAEMNEEEDDNNMDEFDEEEEVRQDEFDDGIWEGNEDYGEDLSSPLIIAVANGDLSVAQSLLDAGADTKELPTTDVRRYGMLPLEVT